MVKLIVSDLDGTLLNDKKELPENFGALLVEMNQKGILFATGSGRTYVTQKKHFEAFCDKMCFICDNGAYIVENGVNTFVSAIPEEEWKKIVVLVEAGLPEAVTVICGINGTYCRDYSSLETAAGIMSANYVGIKFVDRLTDVNDSIFKVSVCQPYAAEEMVLPLIEEHCKGRIKCLRTDPSFVDILNSEVSKGGAIEFIRQKHKLTRSETMAFGDYYNDIDMLEQADFSYVMENAPEDMRVHGRYLAPSNNEGGVATVIKDYLESI